MLYFKSCGVYRALTPEAARACAGARLSVLCEAAGAGPGELHAERTVERMLLDELSVPGVADYTPEMFQCAVERVNGSIDAVPPMASTLVLAARNGDDWLVARIADSRTQPVGTAAHTTRRRGLSWGNVGVLVAALAVVVGALWYLRPVSADAAATPEEAAPIEQPAETPREADPVPEPELKQEIPVAEPDTADSEQRGQAAEVTLPEIMS